MGAIECRGATYVDLYILHSGDHLVQRYARWTMQLQHMLSLKLGVHVLSLFTEFGQAKYPGSHTQSEKANVNVWLEKTMARR